MMNGISSKIGFGAAAGAVTSILVWILSQFGVIIPGDTAAAITVVITFIVGFFVPETATVDLVDTNVKSVVSSQPVDKVDYPEVS